MNYWAILEVHRVFFQAWHAWHVANKNNDQLLSAPTPRS